MTSPPPNQCAASEKLNDLLEGSLSDADSDAMVIHLEQCATCRFELEAIAGEHADWVGARQVLLSAANSSGLGPAASQPGGTERISHLRNDAWAEAISKKLLSPPSHPEMLGRIGRYDIERWIGAGGMGIVFKGFDTELHRAVAIKVLAPSLALNGTARHRFAREARAAAAVVHEDVVPIYDVEANREIPFLVMRFVPGESLQSRIDREGPLELKQILRIGKQLASGLAAAHAQGLIHRDVKPANVLLEPGIDRAMLTDFGLAQTIDDANITTSGLLPGTPQYMSPEQARGEKLTVQSDLFSAGSVLYAMCTGRAPFRAETPLGVLRKIGDTTPTSIRSLNPEIPDWLERIVDKAMSKHPKDRFGSAAELSQLLEECLAHVQQPLSTPLPATLRRPLRWPGLQSRWSLVGWTAGVLAIGLLGIGLAWHRFDTRTSQTAGSTRAPSSVFEPDAGSFAAPIIPAPNGTNNGSSKGTPSSQPIVWKVQPLPRTPEDAILEHLDAPIRVAWNAVPLAEAIRELLAPFAVDVSTSEAQRILADGPAVKLEHEGSRRQILQRLLGPRQLAPILHPGRIEITDLDYAKSHPTIRRVCLSSITRDSREASALARMLQRMVEPQAWTAMGGPCEMSLFGPVLIVKGTEAMHQEIAEILAQRAVHMPALELENQP